ncbi:DISARM system SNF2-like helicase DrmD [Singulisphaera sp. Ch08]|uniref:DISARM system SNF2-like helicase DrmD n=1 Tax=Singulisphaera sp. Ch08 TaxID=3120278 RepID=A0AAU7CAB3_9BACT
MTVRPTIDPRDVGKIVHVRQRRYLVDDVSPCEGTSSTIVRLSCIDPDNLGRTLEVIWEKEQDAEVLDSENWGTLAGESFDPPDQFSAYYHSLRWNRVTASRTDLLQAPFRAGISIEHYQLEPLRMALTMPRVNLFVADGVGLGKTIEAGLVARELLLRRKVSDIVVCCPPSMLLQWQEEMESRFGLLFQIIDRAYVHRIRKERGFSVNPWATHNRFIISHNLVKDEDYAADLRTWLGRDLVRPRSLLILDEAHHAAPASTGAYAITSQFTRRIMEIAPKFEHKLFLSATPHNGHSNSFSALMAILDPQRFCRGVPVGAKERDQVLIYRLKEDLRDLEISFPQRVVEPVLIKAPVKGTPELELANKLDIYCTLREGRLQGEPAKIRSASAFLKSGLQQRLLSSVEAFWRTLLKHKRTIQEQLEQHGERRRIAETELDELALAAIGGGLDADDDTQDDLNPTESTATEPVEDAATVEAELQTEKATLATLGNPDHPTFSQEMKLLDEMLEMAEWARHRPDEKLKALIDYIHQNMLNPKNNNASTGASWTGHRILIFTEYDDTLTYVRRQLEAHLESTHMNTAGDRLAVYKGATSLEERQEIKEAFNTDPTVNPVRILLATDAAREGLNLQKHCFNLFHYDIPWNPARLEQRNGRIDRKLQPSPTVYCRYFLYENREEDTILRRIVEKTENIYRELGGFGTVLDKNLVQTLRRRGIERAQLGDTVKMFDFHDDDEDQRAALALAEVSGGAEDDEHELGPAPAPRESARERIDRRRRERLEKSLERLRKIMEESRRWLDFRETQFRAALDCALRLMEIEGGLTPEPTERPKARSYLFPTSSLEKNPTWRETINSLRSPRRRGEDFGSWQARCPIRPIVFEDPGVTQLGAPTSDSDRGPRIEPVHMHLEHRISQRLLGRFQSQGFMYQDLSRACLAQTKGSLPLVYLLGRLCLYGQQATRLHEDVIAVCAEWFPPGTRNKGLRPVDPNQLSEEEFMRRLDDALLSGDTSRVTDLKRQELLTTAGQDVRELQVHLEKKANTLEKSIRRELLRAGEHEAESLLKLLNDQRKRIDLELEKREREDASALGKAQEREAKAGPSLFDGADGPKLLIYDERARRERAAEKRAMEKRRKDIEREVLEEPDRIRGRYAVQTVRLEPVGIVYLWPDMG